MKVKNKKTQEILELYSMNEEIFLKYWEEHYDDFWSDFNWLIFHKNFTATLFDYIYFKNNDVFCITEEQLKLYEVIEE